MKRMFLFLVLAIAASADARAQSCSFVVTPDAGGDRRLFNLTLPAGVAVDAGSSAGPYGAFWGADGTRPATRMETTGWGSLMMQARLPAAEPLPEPGRTYRIRLRARVRVMVKGVPLPVAMDCESESPVGIPGVLPTQECPVPLVVTPPVARPGDTITVEIPPPGRVSKDDSVELVCLSDMSRRTDLRMFTRFASSNSLRIGLPAKGLECKGGLYQIRVGRCTGQLTVSPLAKPNCKMSPNAPECLAAAASCRLLAGAAERFSVSLPAASEMQPGLPVAASLLFDGGAIPADNVIEVNDPAGAPVRARVSVRWSVSEDAEGARLLGEGHDYSVTPGSTHGASFLFAPQIVEAVAGAARPTTRRYLRAAVSYSVMGPAGTASCGALSVAAPLDVPALPIPTALTLFRGTQFGASERDKAILVVVPTSAVTSSGAPIDSLGALSSELNALQSTVSSLRSLTSFAPFAASFLPGLSELRNALSSASAVGVRFRLERADEINHLGHLAFSEPTFWDPLPLNAEDLFRSLILVGAPGKRVVFFNARDRRDSEGSFHLTVGPGGVALIRVLGEGDAPASFRPMAAPVAEGGLVVMTRAPDGWYPIVATPCWSFDLAHHINTFGCELSSLGFVR